MPRFAHALGIAAALGAGVALADAPAVRYTTVLAADGRTLDVTACVAAPARGRRWTAESRRAPAFLLEASRTSGAAVERDGADLLARAWQADECLRYRVDLAALTAAGRHRRQVGGLLAPPEDWLWRPNGVDRDARAALTMELPSGWSAITPWPSADPMPPRRRFELDLRTATWSSLVAFGRFPERDVVTDGGRARLALLGGMTDRQRDVLTDYVERVSRDVTATFPRMFATGPQIVVVPSRGRNGDAVPWGETMRGGAVALYLVADLDRTHEDYFRSWTVHHEMVHLVHPYLDDEGRWIAEGLATYYQNVLRARGGRIGARRAWENLEAGFERGRRDRVTTDLRTTSARLGRAPHYMRVYWAGTALALRADVALRTRADDPASLDAALNGFLACCLAKQPVLAPRAYLAALDRAVGGGPLVALYDAHVAQPDMPDLRETWAALGITADGGTLHFDADPRHVELRTAIMGSDVATAR